MALSNQMLVNDCSNRMVTFPDSQL